MSGGQHRCHPQRAGVRTAITICVKCVYAVVFRRHEDNVMRLPSDRETGKVKRLGIDLAIHRLREQLPELGRVHVRSSQNSFLEILSSTANIVVICCDAGLGAAERGIHSRQNSQHDDQEPRV